MSNPVAGLGIRVIACPKWLSPFPVFREHEEEVECFVGECEECGRYWKVTPTADGKAKAEELIKS